MPFAIIKSEWRVMRRLSRAPSVSPRKRIKALLKIWPALATKEIGKSHQNRLFGLGGTVWHLNGAPQRSTTQLGLRKILEIGIEKGARYDNPARFIKRASERPETSDVAGAGNFAPIC